MLYYAGLDIGKRVIDVCILKGEEKPVYQHYPNSSKGYEALLKELHSACVDMVICEPTGGYERALCQYLFCHGMNIHRVNTYAFVNFARSISLCKNDRYDSYKLAFYGQRLQPSANYHTTAIDERLKSCVQRREDLVETLGTEKRRLEHAHDQEVEDSLKRSLIFLQQEIKALDTTIQHIIESIPPMAQAATLLETVPGIGRCLAAKLVSYLPELGQESYSLNQLASIVGIAPFNRDSGLKTGRRFTRGGRRIPRDALYMAVLTGRKATPFLQTFYDRLVAKGKPKKVAIVACMRKLLAMLHSLLKANRPFQLFLPQDSC